ncbi:Hypothetical Protein FCC1311_091101 [Hondaea fermentalgiana]|uniref:Uncharacterized protein n=1 Tax=Hondaea fermentalgiana TaxID=2315210 RepID=A0A2R5GMZ3_9STRA|nr:Hypothetical Protein FCC1311_091101 [Hondaea fermentalgiana]|eukprot:GBG31098.1 Hypothetical Protein FCC1311_091101 [Hondaea fermentalgiana]
MVVLTRRCSTRSRLRRRTACTSCTLTQRRTLRSRDASVFAPL